MPSHDQDFLRELLTVFSAEAQERLAALDGHLLALEREQDAGRRAELVREVMRELHTLKGSTGAVDMPDVSHLAHALEGVFAGLDPAQELDPAFAERAYLGLDGMRSLVDDHVSGRDPTQRADDIIAAVTWSAPAAEPPSWAAIPSVPDPAPVPEPPAPAAPVRSPVGGVTADETVRIATGKLDALMSRTAELTVARLTAERHGARLAQLGRTIGDWERERRASARDQVGVAPADPHAARRHELDRVTDARLAELARSVGTLREDVEADTRRLGEVAGELEREVRRTRMLPVTTVIEPLHRVVRDLAHELGKAARLVVHGGDTEVDRSVLEQLRAPLTHVVRNSVDHGLEAPEARVAAGKEREGTLRIAATERAGSLILAITDDGAGMDVARIRDTAVGRGIVTADQAARLGDREVLRLVLRSGFSTTASVSDISGRGVGLDAVREVVERMHGSLEVASEPGAGATITLSMPLSVATTRCLLVRAAGQRFALPVTAVTRLVPVRADDLGRAQGHRVLRLEDGPVVVARLDDVLQLTSDAAPADRAAGIVIGSEERRFALIVDELLDTLDVVVKPLPYPFRRVRHVAGATALGTGEAVVVLNTADLVRSTLRASLRADGAAVPPAAGARRDAPTVLVVDDSIVTRMLEKGILEAAGYRVRVAADGADAWRLLRSDHVDLVVSDVNMPAMDGLALTERIRADERLGALPVVLVTSLEATDDRERGMRAGADAYIVKSNFSQDGLLAAVGRLLPAA